MQSDGTLSANGNGDTSDIERRVRLALEHVKPYLQVDGGSVELVRIDMDARVAEVCLLGACRDCSLASMTLRAGIERAVLHEAPELRRIEAVSRPEIEQLFNLKMN
ncbi:MAG TPA: NifU family protein [Candidatus Kapabacteria bacterium]|nr:NifU family protein [Candidatus Kapabacteria bacterium]